MESHVIIGDAVVQKSVLALLQQKHTFLPIKTSSRCININLKNLEFDGLFPGILNRSNVLHNLKPYEISNHTTCNPSTPLICVHGLAMWLAAVLVVRHGHLCSGFHRLRWDKGCRLPVQLQPLHWYSLLYFFSGATHKARSKRSLYTPCYVTDMRTYVTLNLSADYSFLE
jgi:hypothetical protein